MDSAVVEHRTSTPSHTASEARRRPRHAEAEAAVRTLIADTIQEVLEPRGVGVVIEAAHQCMTTRGIRKPGVSMVTSRLLGAFRDDRTTRREFLSRIGSHRNALHES